jgi:hypothetical protein
MAVFSITAGADDGHFTETGGIFSSDATLMILGYSIYSYMDFFCFRNIGIPKNATITSAIFSVYGRATSGDSTAVFDIYFLAEDDATPPTGYEDGLSRSLTSSPIEWTDGNSWVNGTIYDSPELKTSLQQVVDRSGWVSGNDICLITKNTGSANRRCYGYEGTTTIPYLTVTWEGGGSTPTFTPRTYFF